MKTTHCKLNNMLFIGNKLFCSHMSNNVDVTSSTILFRKPNHTVFTFHCHVLYRMDFIYFKKAHLFKLNCFQIINAVLKSKALFLWLTMSTKAFSFCVDNSNCSRTFSHIRYLKIRE